MSRNARYLALAAVVLMGACAHSPSGTQNTGPEMHRTLSIKCVATNIPGQKSGCSRSISIAVRL